MAGADTMTLVETVVSDIARAIGDRFTEADEQWLTTVLNNFAASVVTKVLPEDQLMRAEVLRKAREAGINIDQVQAPGV
jgi:hypothetical protein